MLIHLLMDELAQQTKNGENVNANLRLITDQVTPYAAKVARKFPIGYMRDDFVAELPLLVWECVNKWSADRGSFKNFLLNSIRWKAGHVVQAEMRKQRNKNIPFDETLNETLEAAPECKEPDLNAILKRVKVNYRAAVRAYLTENITIQEAAAKNNVNRETLRLQLKKLQKKN